MNVLSIGEVLWDLFPDGPRFGGAPANFACHAAINGASVTLLSAVGDDPRGRDVVNILRGFGVDVGLIQTRADAPTGTVGVALDHAGKPTFTIHEAVAWDDLKWTREVADRVACADAVYFGTLAQRSDTSRVTIRRALDAARRAGVPRIVDVNLRSPFFDDGVIRESVERSTILKLSDDELPAVASACGLDPEAPPASLLQRLREAYCLDHVVMTRGARGAMLVNLRAVTEHPGVTVSVEDTVGAGDAFTAGFLLSVLRGCSDERLLQDACGIAAAACGHAGAVPRSAGADGVTHSGKSYVLDGD